MKRDYRVTLLYVGFACMILSFVFALSFLAGLFLGVICNSSIVHIVLFVTSMLLGIASIILLVIGFAMNDTVLTSQVLRLIGYSTIFLLTICLYCKVFELL